MKLYFCVMLAAVAAAGAAPAGRRPASAPRAAASRPATVVKFDHLRLDLAGRRVVLDAEVCLRSGPLELLLCLWQSKEHESILRTKARPSDLHAALLALGLTPGKPARWSGLDKSARFLPPQGPLLQITLRWLDKAGTEHQGPAGEWLGQVQQAKAAAPARWVFVGSEVPFDGGYWADDQGDIITVSNFPSAVIDVPFESTDANAALTFVAKTRAIPPKGTKVYVIIQPLPGADRAAHARAFLDVDGLGRLRLAGRPIAADKLNDLAAQFVDRHSKAQIVIRADPRALVYDVMRAREIIEMAGIRDIQERYLAQRGEVLPRTPRQARRALAQWEGKFAAAEQLLSDPAEQAATLLKHIKRRIEQLDATKAMWQEYAAHVRQAMDAYKASTQPADPGAK